MVRWLLGVGCVGVLCWSVTGHDVGSDFGGWGYGSDGFYFGAGGGCGRPGPGGGFGGCWETPQRGGGG